LQEPPVNAPANPPSASPASDLKGDLQRRIGFWGASALMVGVIIGSGIFRTPTEIAQALPHPPMILALWLAGGLLALAGALTYAELSCRFPASGGLYVFLRESYGPGAAFVFGWTYMLVAKPAAAAGIAVIFAQHVNTLLGVDWDPRIMTIASVVGFTALNAAGVELGARVAEVLTGIKVLALVAVALLVFALARDGSWSNFTPSPEASARLGEVSLWLALVPVMAAILWTYDGWADVGAIAGEVQNPQRTLPRVFMIGTGFVILLYVAVNAAYIYALPIDRIARESTLAPVIMDILLGKAGAVAVTILVILSTLGSTHGSIMTGARVTFAQARDGLMFRPLGTVSRRGTPAFSLWTQCSLSCLAALWLETFDKLAGSFVFTMWIFYAAAGVGLFILRRRQAREGTPPPRFLCPGYPVVPGLFVLAAAGMTVLAIREDPKMTLTWVGVLAAGVPVYMIWKWTRRRSAA
jgi:APA family basic amino acid/polyamine antiporter